MANVLRFDPLRRLRRAYGSLADPPGRRVRRWRLSIWLYPFSIAVAGAVGFAAIYILT
jgi:hypothetical protein